MKRFEKQVIVYTSICHALVHIFELTYGVVLIGIAQEFGIGLFILGVLANIAGFTFGLASLPAGLLADRIGERRLLVVYSLSSGLAAIAVGFAPNVYILGGALAILGLGIGIYHPVGAALITRTTEHQGIAFAYQGVAGSLGVALGPFLAGITAASLGWRAPYFIFAIPALLLAALLYSFAKVQIPVVSEPVTQADNGRTSSKAIILPLVLILLVSISNGLIYRGLVTFLPVYFIQRLHITFFNWGSMALAGSFTTIALIFGGIGQLTGGYLAESRRHEWLAMIVAAATTPLLLLIGNSEEMILLLSAIVFAFFSFMGQPVYNTLIADYTPATWRGRIYGIYFFCNFGLGSFSATFLGYIAQRSDVHWVFIVMAIISVISLTCSAILLARALTTAGNGGIAKNRM